MKTSWQDYPWNDIIKMLSDSDITLTSEEITTARTIQELLESFLAYQTAKTLRILCSKLTDEEKESILKTISS